MTIQDLLQLSVSQIQSIQNSLQGTSTASATTVPINTQFTAALQTALTAVNDALQAVAAETGAAAMTSSSGTIATDAPTTAPATDTATLLAVSQQAATATAAATSSSQVVIPQKGPNGYYNQDPRPTDPIAPANIHSADIQQQIAAYDHDQLALVVWQQKEIAMANAALRQRGAYDWEGSPLRPQPGSGDWQSEFNWRIQAMRDQGLAVDTYLSNVTMS